MTEATRGSLFASLTGQDADVSGSTTGDVVGQLLAVGGSSTRTRSGIDLTRAAQRLEVSRRTVERWVKTSETGTGQRPSPGHARSLARRARQAATTRAGRQTAMQGSAVRQAITSRGARVSISGDQGPRAMGRDYPRNRTTQLVLDPADAQAMVDAWEAGGEQGFMAWATGYWGDEYLDGWKFEPDVTVDIERPTGGRWR